MMQTLLASLKFRKRGQHAMERNAKRIVLQCSDGVRLAGSLSRHHANKGFVVFLHGWEGSENSTYVMSCARLLYDKGCSVFRLNFRDHGDTHDLNEGIFHSANFQEVLDGVTEAAKFAEGAPVYLVGFSLGGNFALRISRHLSHAANVDIEHVFAISPVVDPEAASPKVDENSLIRKYFYKKWSTSLLKKQKAFPELYDFSDLLKIETVMGITKAFLPKYTEFANESEYFDAYKIGRNDLSECIVPTSIIMAKDDPVIPAEDLRYLSFSENVRKIMLDHGGHNGFFQSLTGPTWYDDYIQSVIFKED